MATIQGIYIALFGRPADPGGLAYWNSVTNNGSDLSKLIGQLTASPEYTARFAGKSSAEIVTSIYQSLFGRAPDATGLDFFTKGLASGTLKLETLAINILDGAQGADKTIVDNKTTAADLFTKSLDTPAEIAAYNGNAAAELGRAFLTKVTDDKTTIPSQTDVDKAVTGVVTPSGGQGPAEGGTTGGGSSPSGPSGPQPNTYKINDVVTANNAGKLFVGSGNSAGGFAITTNPNNGIELGLSVRHHKADVAAGIVSGNDKIVHFYDQDINGLTFAYSAHDKDGIDLSKNTYKLVVDKDPGAGNQNLTFILQSGNTASGYKWVFDADNSGTIDSGETVAITDDGKNTDGNAVQNIQPLEWLLKGQYRIGGTDNGGKPGIYDIKLVATDAANNDTVTAVQIHASEHTTNGVVANSDGKLYAGKGNSADGFAKVQLAEGVELGIAGRMAGTGTALTKTVSNADKLVHYSASEGSGIRFAYSIASEDKKLSDFTFKLKVDTNPNSGPASESDYVVMTLNGTDAVSNKNTSNSTYSWERTSEGNTPNAGLSGIGDDGGDGAIGKVTQNIENIAWFTDKDATKLAAGHYDVILEAYQGATLIGTNHVVFDIV